MSKQFDALVIGAGPAGEVCAGHLADGGMKVAIAESELVAGECSYWACMPSKTLLRPGETVAAAERAWGARKAVTGEIDVAEALAWRNEVVSNYDDSGQLPWLEERGIELFRGAREDQGEGRRQRRRGRDRGREDRHRHRLLGGDPSDRRPRGPRGDMDQPRGHRHEGGPEEHPGSRRRPGRRRDEPGADALRREGDPRRGRRPRCSPARPRRPGRSSQRPWPMRAWSCA